MASGNLAESVDDELSQAHPRSLVMAGVLVLAVVAVFVSFRTVERLESTRLKLEFERAANDRVRALRADLDSYVNDLYAMSAFYRASEAVTRAEFSEFARPLHLRHRGVRAFNWLPRIGEAERASYEARVSAEIPGFRILEQGPDGELRVAGPRTEYFPVDFIEPTAGNERARGFDLGSDPGVYAALVATRDSGSPSIAGPVSLIGDEAEKSGYLALLPHYAGEDPPKSLSERRTQLIGIIVGVLQLADAVRGAVEGLAPAGIAIEIGDRGRTITSYPTTTQPSEVSPLAILRWPSALAYSVADSVPFGDRELSIICRPTVEFLRQHASPLPWIVLGGGSLFVLALWFYFERLRHEQRERRRASHALAESERRYRVLVEHAPEAVVVYDMEAERFIDANENAARLFRRPREQLLRLGPVDLSPTLQPDGRSSASIVRVLLDEALAGGTPVAPWVYRDSAGNDRQCEVRLVRLPPFERKLVRGSIIDVTERRQAEARQLMMARELDHRVKNNLAEVIALAEQTGNSSRSYTEFREAFTARLRAMARTHEALAARHWKGVPLHDVVELTLGPYDGRAEERIAKHGAAVMLGPSASSALCLTLHELAANAAKYGALAVASGRVELSWHRDADGGLRLQWQESGGPPVTRPERAGFGTRLVEGVVAHELGGRATIDFRVDGVRCEILVPSEHLEEGGAPA